MLSQIKLKQHGLDLKSLRFFLIAAPIVYVATVIVSGLFLFGLKQIDLYRADNADYTYIGEYFNVNPLFEGDDNRTYHVNEPMYFQTDRVLHRDTQLDWHDIVYCHNTFGEKYHLHTNQQSGFRKAHERKKLIWLYRGPRPKMMQRCYAQHIIVYTDIETGVSKVQFIENPDNDFYLSPESKESDKSLYWFSG